jgi:hypothetical protein
LRFQPAVRYSNELKKPVTTSSFVGSSTSSQYDRRRIDAWVGLLTPEFSIKLSKKTTLKLGGEYQDGKTYDSYRLFGKCDCKF